MFDAKAFLYDQFQNPAMLRDRLLFFSLPAPSPAQVQKWFDRRRVPGDWLPTLLYVLELEGRQVSVTSYMRKRK